MQSLTKVKVASSYAYTAMDIKNTHLYIKYPHKAMCCMQMYALTHAHTYIPTFVYVGKPAIQDTWKSGHLYKLDIRLRSQILIQI